MTLNVLRPRLCACGCGEYAATNQRRSRVSRFISGHNSRGTSDGIKRHPMQNRKHSPKAIAKIKEARARQTAEGRLGGRDAWTDPDERFDSYVIHEPNTGCHLWTGATTHHGYGAFGIGSTKNGSERIVGAHRYAYERIKGPILDHLEIDHLCSTPPCVNPAHLEAVTHKENLRRGKERRANQSAGQGATADR